MGRKFENANEHLRWCKEELDRIGKESLSEVLPDLLDEIPLALLKRLMAGELLSTITEDDFLCENESEGFYVCNRWPGLYMLKTDDFIRVIDQNAVAVHDINTHQYVYEPFVVAFYFDHIANISFPYMPLDCMDIIHIEKFAYDDADFVAICYVQQPNGHLIEIKRFFKRDAQKCMEEITLTDYAIYRTKSGLEEEDQNE